ncbi:MAG: hypothetical protein HY606_12365, partial [Planctomycetes bacterium]|nr:hypothetical protein [Planctomycetota bacterium]
MKEKKQDAGIPAWMVTMGDMNTLLLTFFVLMFTMMTLEVGPKRKQETNIEEMRKLGSTRPGGPSLFEPKNEGGLFTGTKDKSSDADLEFLRSLERVDTAENSYIITLGTHTKEFNPAEWALTNEHINILNRITPILKKQSKTIIIRGHTESKISDSLI